MIEFSWPGGVFPDLAGNPCVRFTVTTPRDQAQVHRTLARLGYVPEPGRLEVHEGWELWQYQHPDGERWR